MLAAYLGPGDFGDADPGAFHNSSAIRFEEGGIERRDYGLGVRPSLL